VEKHCHCGALSIGKAKTDFTAGKRVRVGHRSVLVSQVPVQKCINHTSIACNTAEKKAYELLEWTDEKVVMKGSQTHEHCLNQVRRLSLVYNNN
jgi:hypothetical protein